MKQVFPSSASKESVKRYSCFPQKPSARTVDLLLNFIRVSVMAPSPSPSPSPSKKLLMKDPKPRLAPNSASSSSATSTPPPPTEKRTRDQPNLSDCHCCGRRIIHTNPKDRLQPLDSVWRIVLLCRKCRRSVCSALTCPYCFKGTANSGDLCTCRVCNRKIHKDCVRDYGKFTPWCYLGTGFEGFRVCVDCWVPELLKNSVHVSGLGDTGLKDKGEGDGSLENVDRKVRKAVKRKAHYSTRAKGPIGEGNLVDDAYGSLSKNNRDIMKAGNSICTGETEVPDDAEVAIQLHLVINSSPRIWSGKPQGNSNGFEASDIRIWKGLSYKRSSGLGKRCSKFQELEISANSAVNGRMNETVENDSSNEFSGLSSGLIPYRRDRKRNVWQLDDEYTEVFEYTSNQQEALKNLDSDGAGDGCSPKSGSDTSENSIRANIGGNSSSTKGGRFRQELISYKRNRFRKKESPLNDQTNVSGDSSSCDNHEVDFKSECYQSDYANHNATSVVKCDDPEDILLSGSDTERDRYHLKYVKRIPGAKNDSSFLHYGTFLSEIQASAPSVSHSEAAVPVPDKDSAHARDRYSFKYAKRVKSPNFSSNAEAKMHSDAFVDKVGGSAMGSTTNCSAESRTVSNASFDSSTDDLPQ